MADYISRQEAIDRFENLSYADWNQGASTTWANAFSECADMIRELPSADVVEVVRCKDCKHNPKDTWFECPLAHLPVHDDRWCWKGERKDGQ